MHNLSRNLSCLSLTKSLRNAFFKQNLVLLKSVFYIMYFLYGEGRDSLVSTATGYGLDVSGFESRCGRDFTHPSRPAVGPTQPPIQWVPGISRGLSGRGVALTTHPHLAPRLKEGVELYLYFSSGLWWPVLG